MRIHNSAIIFLLKVAIEKEKKQAPRTCLGMIYQPKRPQDRATDNCKQ